MSLPGQIGIYRIASLLGSNDMVKTKTYLAFRGTDNTPRLLKVFTLDAMDQDDITRVLNEIQVLSSIRHPNILNYYESFLQEELRALVVVTECCEEGSLSSLLERVFQKDTSAIQLLNSKIRRILCQMVLALREINRHSLVHRNINPKDIFIDDSGNIKLGGFEHSRKQAETPNEANFPPQPSYSAPETFELEKYSLRSDLWSIGVVLYVMLYFELPFAGTDVASLVEKIKTTPLSPPKECQLGGEFEDLVSLVPKLIKKHPLQRLTVENLLALKVLNSEFKALFQDYPDLLAPERLLGQTQLLLPAIELKNPGQIPSNFNKQLKHLRKLRVLKVLEGQDDLEDVGPLMKPVGVPTQGIPNTKKKRLKSQGSKKKRQTNQDLEVDLPQLVQVEDLVRDNLRSKSVNSDARQTAKMGFDPRRLPKDELVDDTLLVLGEQDPECSVCHHKKGTLPIVNRDVLVPQKLEHIKKMWNNQFLEEILRMKAANYTYVDQVRPLTNLKIKLGIDPVSKPQTAGNPRVFYKSVDQSRDSQRGNTSQLKSFVRGAADTRTAGLDRVPTQDSNRRMKLPEQPDIQARGMPSKAGTSDARFVPEPYVDEIKAFADGKYMNMQEFKKSKKTLPDMSNTPSKQRQLLRDIRQNQNLLPPLNK